MAELSKAAARPPKWAKPTIEIDEKEQDEIHHRFEIAIGESLLQVNSKSVMALAMVGHAYTKVGDHKKALTIDRSLVGLLPEDPVCHYNLACSLSNLGQLEDALTELELAIRFGYEDVRFMEKDPDLANVRRDPRFRKLMQRLKKPR
ncbi:MAG: hypothetical protein HYZ53_09180 [Planctomycetes bacterium]|nr:hypothetical protein [Planctomycetota bacterium]